MKFTRVKLNKSIFHSVSYRRASARNSYTVKFIDSASRCECYGQVLYYFQFQDQYSATTTHNLVFIKQFSVCYEPFYVDSLTNTSAYHIKTVFATDDKCKLTVLPIINISAKCVFIEDFSCQGKAFVIEMPNHWEND